MKEESSAIIVAGGKGLRMNSQIPKQFIEICGKPVLMHTIGRFRAYSSDIQIILVLPAEQIDYWNKLCTKHGFTIAHTVVSGGETRFYSVKNGLDLVNTEYVAIHDGVRPLVSLSTIRRCFEEVKNVDAVVPVVDLVDSLRYVENNDKSSTVDRSKYKLVQTPQGFNTQVLKQSYQLPYSENFTDDASVVENAGYQVKLVDGNRENIKITTEIDLKIAELFLKSI